MTLFKQIFLLFLAIFVAVLFVVLGINFRDSKEYIQKELFVKAQNSASTLGLTLSQVKNADPVTMSTIANSVFDSGYFQKIYLITADKKVLFNKERKEKFRTPNWFNALISLENSEAVAQVSNGWKPVGILHVIPDRSLALEYLYSVFKKVVIVFVVSFLMGSLVLYIFLKAILKPLYKVQKQAEGVLTNKFIFQKETPKTYELKIVTDAINLIIHRLEEVNSELQKAISNRWKMQYIDPVTDFGNKNYFVLKYNEMTSTFDGRERGVVALLRVNGTKDANEIVGYNKVNEIYKLISKNIKESINGDSDIYYFRISGTEFVLLFADKSLQLTKQVLETILSKSREDIEQYQKVHNVIYLSSVITEYSHKFSSSDMLSRVDTLLKSSQKCLQDSVVVAECKIDLPKSKEEWFRVVDNALKLQMFEDDHMEIFFKNANKRAFWKVSYAIIENDTKLPYRLFVTYLYQFGLFGEYMDFIFQKIIEDEKFKGESLILNIPMEFVKRDEFFNKIQKNADILKKKDISIIIELTQSDFEEIKSQDFLTVLMEKLYSFGLKVGISGFDANDEIVKKLRYINPYYVSMYDYSLLGLDREFGNSIVIMLKSRGIKLLLLKSSENENLSNFSYDYVVDMRKSFRKC